MCIEEQLDNILLGPPRREFSCLMANLPEPFAQEILSYASQIDINHLVDDGIPEHIHVTIKYGIHNDTPDDIYPILRDTRPVQFTLGPMSIFRADQHRPSDVLKIDVIGPQLFDLNSKISRATECTDTYSYSPHVTIAKLKPGMADQYISNQFAGKQVVVPELVFSSKNRQVTTIPLGRT